MNGEQPGAHCPSCGARAERGQLVCLECGSRIALVYRRPPSWKVPAAITALVALVLGGAAALGWAALSDDADREVAAAPPRPRQAAKAEPAAKKQEAGQKRQAGEKRASGKGDGGKPAPAAAEAGGIVRRGSLYAWPRTLEGFTVVINSTEDRASATTFARSAAKSKPAKLGVLRADDFRTLPKGFYVVFAGHYETRGRADQATARLGRRYRGAFTQSVQR